MSFCKNLVMGCVRCCFLTSFLRNDINFMLGLSSEYLSLQCLITYGIGGKGCFRSDTNYSFSIEIILIPSVNVAYGKSPHELAICLFNISYSIRTFIS